MRLHEGQREIRLGAPVSVRARRFVVMSGRVMRSNPALTMVWTSPKDRAIKITTLSTNAMPSWTPSMVAR